jgi:hypothetical protein
MFGRNMIRMSLHAQHAHGVTSFVFIAKQLRMSLYFNYASFVFIGSSDNGLDFSFYIA